MLRRIRINWLVGVLLTVATTTPWAQTALAVPPSTLKQAFDAAWARQPEARSLDARREAALARRQSADSWTAEPPALELSGKSDQFNKNRGSREYEVGLAIPLWLPGERSHTGALADAEVRATASGTLAAQLRTAASVREAYWLWQRAQIDVAVARERLANARELSTDVAKRVKVGDLARADQHQAEGALASAESSVAEADSALSVAVQQLRALTGMAPPDAAEGGISLEPEPVAALASETLDTRHPAVTELLDRADVARRAVTLAGVQGSANPELTLASTRERGASDESWQQTVTVGLRIPLGSDTRNRARVASANAEAIEAETQLRLERERLLAEVDTARVRVEAARAQVAAAQKRSQLAQETRGFFQKSFRLGETDLPTRLRIELEAAEAERQAARTRIELAAAVSALRQTMGLLPE
jgi:cobalt-zinc-cadmium efflux system outer membrane protein